MFNTCTAALLPRLYGLCMFFTPSGRWIYACVHKQGVWIAFGPMVHLLERFVCSIFPYTCWESKLKHMMLSSGVSMVYSKSTPLRFHLRHPHQSPNFPNNRNQRSRRKKWPLGYYSPGAFKKGIYWGPVSIFWLIVIWGLWALCDYRKRFGAWGRLWEKRISGLT